jgi:sporulation protein YlmC with PRC-barrel domain
LKHESRETMRRFIVVVTLLAVVGLLLPTGAFAQLGTPQPEPRPAPPAAPVPRVTLQSMPEWYGSRLIGTDVKNPQGQGLGEVAELVLNPQDGKIESVVISTGGVLGIGAKRVAVPWNQVKPATDEPAFIVAMTKDELQQAPNWERAAEKAMPATPPATMPPGQPGR